MKGDVIVIPARRTMRYALVAYRRGCMWLARIMSRNITLSDINHLSA